MSSEYEIARCRREQQEMRRQQDAPAWLVALGIEDWEAEIRLINGEMRRRACLAGDAISVPFASFQSPLHRGQE